MGHKFNYLKKNALIFSLLLAIFTFNTGFAQKPDPSQDNKKSGLTIATFDVDATPPVGSYMAYGRVINTWDMGLRARGIVLLGCRQACSVMFG